MRAFKLAACNIAACLCLAGCGRNGPIEISGAVAYVGQPIRKGAIDFLPADGNGPTAAAIIADGRYSLKVMPGKKRVRIEASKVIGQRRHHPNDPTSRMVDVEQQILPERYNAKSELVCEITAGTRVYDFPLSK